MTDHALCDAAEQQVPEPAVAVRADCDSEVDGQEVNSLLVQRGYACTLYIPPDGEARADEFRALELDAKNARRGLWSACNPLPPACL